MIPDQYCRARVGEKNFQNFILWVKTTSLIFGQNCNYPVKITCQKTKKRNNKIFQFRGGAKNFEGEAISKNFDFSPRTFAIFGLKNKIFDDFKRNWENWTIFLIRKIDHFRHYQPQRNDHYLFCDPSWSKIQNFISVSAYKISILR